MLFKDTVGQIENSILQLQFTLMSTAMLVGLQEFENCKFELVGYPSSFLLQNGTYKNVVIIGVSLITKDFNGTIENVFGLYFSDNQQIKQVYSALYNSTILVQWLNEAPTVKIQQKLLDYEYQDFKFIVTENCTETLVF